VNAPPDLPLLLGRIRQGDELAPAEFLEHYELPLRRAAHALIPSLLRPHVDSVDVVQSVYRGLLVKLRDGDYTFAKPDEFLALAMTAIRNKLITKWRRADCEKRFLESLAITPAAGSDRSSADPAAQVDQRDLFERLMRNLTASDRQLVEWQLFGLTPTEMAARLNCDAHALRARLSRLRQTLRQKSGYEDADHPPKLNEPE
jgi:RNA polymerase sigma-70 factor (ECF subfamily)